MERAADDVESLVGVEGWVIEACEETGTAAAAGEEALHEGKG